MPDAAPANWNVSPVGRDCYLYYSTAYASPTRILIPRAQDVSVPTTKGMSDIKSRLSQWIKKRSTLFELSLELGYQYKRGADTVLAALRGSYLSRTPLIFWALDGDVNIIGTQGFVFAGEVSEYPNEQPLEDSLNIKLKVDHVEYYESTTLIEPEWFVVAGS